MTRSINKAQPGTLAWQKQKIREEYVYPILEKEEELAATRRRRIFRRNLYKKGHVGTEV
ncbi:hypothetical protein [Sporolactobacillus sp. KGMB 08714]|uniref:hypothetical protein n=1 Tax=Sporolactobacillus sp. KGMB 08714 TaxID=3064704 RepID=UPI002FBDF786